MVKCPICGLQFDREKVPFKMVGARRYAHEECFNNAEKNKSQEEKDKEALEKSLNRKVDKVIIFV